MFVAHVGLVPRASGTYSGCSEKGLGFWDMEVVLKVLVQKPCWQYASLKGDPNQKVRLGTVVDFYHIYICVYIHEYTFWALVSCGRCFRTSGRRAGLYLHTLAATNPCCQVLKDSEIVPGYLKP